MNPIEQACNTQRIDDYLANHLNAELQLELESHLSKCAACRDQIERRAAEPEVWNHAAQLLGQASNGTWHADEVAWDQPMQDSQWDAAAVNRQAASVLDSLAPTDDPDMLGRIGEYEISGVVGVGGMGAVLKGFDKSLRRVVAVKVMAPHLAGSGSARARFQREARAAAAITHDNVIDIYAVSEAGGLPYLVMPYARGPSLQKRIDDGGPLAVIEVVRIGRQIASGLAAAHEQGLVHRDIKPANILLSDGIERLWITDFGVARAMDDASMTQTGLIAGTPQYMSPEQARGETVDQRSDLFSLGSVLYTACTGRPPFRSEAAYGILRRITDTDPRPIREINSDIPEWLCVIIDRLLAKHPADRFASAEEVVELLDSCLAHLQQPLQVELPQSVSPRWQATGTHLSGTTASNSEESKPQTAAVPAPQLKRPFSQRRGLLMFGSLLFATLLGIGASQLTNPADISGHWSGENWQHVSLSSVGEASDWYSGSFTDADGRRGALRLEWSRLQLRYNGRWKVGEGESGEITLRVGKDGALRGAVSVDPESKVEFDVPRLREFAWQPTSERAQQKRDLATQREEKAEAVGGDKAKRNTLVIDSPAKGTIVRISERIGLHAQVKKGDLIAVISPYDEDLAAHREEQLVTAEQKAEAAFTRIAARENELAAAKEIVEAIEARVENLEAARQQEIRSAEQQLLDARSRLKGLEKDLEEQVSVFLRTTESASEGLASGLELKQAEVNLASQEAQVEKAKAAINEAESQVAALEQGLQAKQLEAQSRLDTAVVELKRAKADLVKLEAELGMARADFENQKGIVNELRIQLKQVQRIEFRAPEDGVITRMPDLRAGGTVKEGDTICELTLDAITNPPSPANKDSAFARQLNSPAAAAPQINPIQSLSVFGPASELVKRVREAQKQRTDSASSVDSSKRRLAERRKVLEELLVNQGQLKEQDAASWEQLAVQIRSVEAELQVNEGSLQVSETAKQNAEAELAEALAERDTILKILQTQLQAAERRLAFDKKSRSAAADAWQAGIANVQELSNAEQRLAKNQSELEQLLLLLKFYSTIGADSDASKTEVTK